MNHFVTDCDKWDTHNTSNVNNNFIIGPTVRIVDENNYRLGFTLHKWEIPPSGKLLAIYIVTESIPKNDKFWDNPNLSDHVPDIKDKLTLTSEKLKSISIEQIEDDEIDEVFIYKYHANQWRQVEKKKSKWTYKYKAVKSDICNVQRLTLK